MKRVNVWEVVYDTGNDGPRGDGIAVYRTRVKGDAETFAAGRTCYGKPATADLVSVPSNIANRWGV